MRACLGYKGKCGKPTADRQSMRSTIMSQGGHGPYWNRDFSRRMTNTGKGKRGTLFARALLATAAVLVLTASFYQNSFRLVPDRWFQTFQKDSESLVIGRLVESEANGPFSAAGLLGRQTPPSQPELIRPFQYFVFLNEGVGVGYQPYFSQSGFHGLIYSILNLGMGEAAAADRLNALRAVTALSSAVALTFIAGWILTELGWFAGTGAWLSIFASQWLTVGGANLWWTLFFFYFPAIAVIALLRRRASIDPIGLGLVVFFTVLVKCTTGFEFVSGVSIMTAVPVVHWHLKRRTGAGAVVRDVSVVAAASAVAVVAALGLLIAQVGLFSGRLSDGVRAVTHALGKRSYGDPELFSGLLKASLESSVLEVVEMYLRGPYYEGRVLSVSYFQVIVLFAAATLVLVLFMRVAPRASDFHHTAFIATTWFSMAAPLSWFVIFKGHSHIHTHVNFLAWQMPFTILGFALTGLALERALASARGAIRNER